MTKHPELEFSITRRTAVLGAVSMLTAAIAAKALYTQLGVRYGR